MKKIIFDVLKITRIDKYTDKMLEYKWGKSPKERDYMVIMDDIKSFKHDPNNGMKWSAEEKASFEKLSHVEKKKYLINKMAISSLKVNFGELEEKQQKEILSNFRFASERGVLKASKELADLLCARNFLYSHKESIKELKEASRLYQSLAKAGSPDGYYGYYKLYRFVKDDEKFYHSSITSGELNVNSEQALKYLNLALEKGLEKSYNLYPLSLDLMMTVGYLYQDRKAFVKAMNYANYAINVFVYELFYTACMRMAIMLGGSLEELIMCYGLSVSVHANKIRAEKLKTYAQNRKLIDGLDPYFDEHFPPDLVLDFGTQFYGNMYGGSGMYPGVYRWIADGKMKDPRDKDSTLATERFL